jgi:hypothetical protein
MKLYIVTAFSAETYSSESWVDSIFDDLAKAQAYVNKYRDENGWAVKIKEDEEDSYGYMISSYIETRELNKEGTE